MTERASPQAPDVVAKTRILILAAAAIVVVALGVWVSTRLEGARAAPPGAVPARRELPEQTLVDSSARGQDLERAQRRRLEHYGWASRDAGLAEIPIERAIDLYVERRR